MATAADLETAIDNVTAQVAQVGTDVTAVLELLTAAQAGGASIPQDAIPTSFDGYLGQPYIRGRQLEGRGASCADDVGPQFMQTTKGDPARVGFSGLGEKVAYIKRLVPVEMTFEEIGTALGITAAGAMYIYNTALAKLARKGVMLEEMRRMAKEMEHNRTDENSLTVPKSNRRS